MAKKKIKITQIKSRIGYSRKAWHHSRDERFLEAAGGGSRHQREHYDAEGYLPDCPHHLTRTSGSTD